MAKQVLTDAFISVDGNDISAYVQSVTLNFEAEAQDCTTMGDDTRENLGGLKNWSIDLTLANDFAASAVDSIIFPLVGTQVTVIVRPASSAVSTSNPNYTGTGLIASYNPLGNSVGDLATAPVSIASAGTLSRATS